MAISLEGTLTRLAQSRPGIVPVALVALLGTLLVAKARRWLIVTLCYGISLLALRDSMWPTPLPDLLDYTIFGIDPEQVYLVGWLLLSLTAAVAGTAEAMRPGSVWARRCYFASASLYLGGHGLLGYLENPNWESVVLVATGLVAVFGIFLAQRIVASEEIAEEDEDIRALADKSRQRSEQLASKEWKETAEHCTKVP